jgi:hypothetical protein
MNMTSEQIVDRELNKLIQAAGEIIYTEEFKKSNRYNTEENKLQTLGLIVSKYCRWDGDSIKAVAEAAFEDANFHDAIIII